MNINELCFAIEKKTNKYVYPEEATKEIEYKCPSCNKDVIFKKGEINKAHFAHKSDKQGCTYYEPTNESQQHREAKILLHDILTNKIPLKFIRYCNSCNNEVDHSYFEGNEILFDEGDKIIYEYPFKLNNSQYKKRADIAWITQNDVNEDIIHCLFEICYKHKTSEINRPDDIEWFEIDAEKLLKMNINININSNSYSNESPLELRCERECFKCESCINNSDNIDINIITQKGKIYFNQRGAGCGKTYESIQLLTNDDRFKNKLRFIYLTKAHSAKDVIYSELCNQQKHGKLGNLIVRENNANSKQYKITYLELNTKRNIEIIIGTIDSFNYAIVDKNKVETSNNYFKSIINAIKQSYISIEKNGSIYYAQKKPILDNDTLITIDEAQDLNADYIEAFHRIIELTNMDLYIIGDKLQSIWYEHNIYTYLENSNLPIDIIKNYGENKVMRFHNIQFIDFVNKLINFKKFGLSPVIDICNRSNCGYTHENNNIPYELFYITHNIYSKSEINEIENSVEDIINKVEYQVNKYNYLPNNFMFIFPILSQNKLAITLETKLQDYWVNKFNENEYKEKVLKYNSYWYDKINDNNFYKYVYLHKNDLGQSINLRESEKATRILSIHASKGSGCEVVFLLGLNEKALNLFSFKTGNLIYESLLHVAITRQKKFIYVGLNNINDDILYRFNLIQPITNGLPNLYNCIENIKYKNIIDYTFNINREECLLINNFYNFILNNCCNNMFNDNIEEKNIIDWGHHVVRFSVLYYNLLFNIMDNENTDIRQKQIYTILKNVYKSDIICCNYNEYNKKLKDIYNSGKDYEKNKNKNKNKILPILFFNNNENSQYYKYCNIIVNMLEHIQNKLKTELKKNKLPKLCPLETILLLHAIHILDSNNQDDIDISIMNVYSLIYCYDNCSSYITIEHSESFDCKCCNYFISISKNYNNDIYTNIQTSIIKHYELLTKINSLYNKFKIQINEIINNEQITYNILHNVSFNTKNSSFKINDNYIIIGNSENYTIFIMLKPQITKLNIMEIMFQLLFKIYFILNCKERTDNYNRYNNKKIISCIISLDLDEPIIKQIDINEYKELFEKYIKQYIYKNYSKYNEIIYEYYNYCKDHKPPNLNGIQYLISCIENETHYKNKFPKYINDYLKYIQEIIKNDNNIKDDLKNGGKKFIANLNEKLEEEINKIFIDNYINNDDF